MSSGLIWALGLVIAGVGLAALVWGTLKLLPAAAAQATVAAGAVSTSSDEAVVLIEPGGRLDFLNQTARQWFSLRDDDPPDLELLLRAVKPVDDFLALCASPGKKVLNLHGRPVEAASHRIPGAHPQMLVSLRSIEPLASFALDSGAPSAPSMLLITEFSRAVSSSLDLDTVLAAVADYVLRLVAVDILEISTRDPSIGELVIRRFEETPAAGPVLVRVAQGRFGSLNVPVLETGKPRLVPDVRALPEADQAGLSSGLASYMAIPISAGEELVGVLEAGQTAGAPFSQEQFDVLQVLAGQSGGAIKNAMLYGQERRHASELSGLANVGQSVTAMREPHELFERLVESIAPLFDVQILGFLLYDETEHVLRGQAPFHGLPPSIVDVYRTTIASGTPAEAHLLDKQLLLTANAAADSTWRELGLGDVAVAASMQDAALVPLLTSGRMLGYLQVSNHRDGPRTFSDSETRLLQIAGNQAASIIDSTRMLWRSNDELRRSEAIRKVADLGAASPTLDAALSQALEELVRVFGARLAVVLLLDEMRGQLRVHAASAFGLTAEQAAALPSLVVDQPEYARTVTARRQPSLLGRLSLDTELLPFYRGFFDAPGVESAVIVPMAAHGKPIGELIMGSQRTEFFDQADVELLSSAATQLASTIERFQQATVTDSSLRRRVDRLTAMARVSREIAGSLSLDHLLQVIHDEGIQLVGADCGSIILADATEGVARHRYRSVGCRSGDELSQAEQRSMELGESLSIADFREDKFPPPHSGVRSALLVPMRDGGRTVGLIELHASRPVAFDAAAQETAETLAAQAAVALSNSIRVEDERRRAEGLKRRVSTLEKLSTATGIVDPEQPLEAPLARLAEGIRNSTPFRVVLISVYEPETGLLRRVAGAGIAAEALAELRGRKQQLSTLRQLLKPEFKIGRSYYIPADQTPLLPPDIHYLYASEYSAPDSAQNAWNPDDFLLLPLEEADGSPLGLISLDDPSNGRRPDQATIESLELFAGQAVQVINVWQRMSGLHTQNEALSSALERQQQLLTVSQNDLPILLHKDLEQTMALHAQDHRTQRVRAGLRIIESVGRQLDTSSALLTLARETVVQLGMAAAMIGENSVDGPRLVRTVGAVPGTVNVEVLFGQRNPLRAALQTGTPILIPDLEENDEWRHTPLLSPLRARGVVCLPLVVEGKTVAAVLAVSLEPLPAFTDEDRTVFEQIARQASVVLQNISLLAGIRSRLHEVNVLLDFSRRLTGLDSLEIVAALLESARNAVAAAHAGVVLMWNEQEAVLAPSTSAGYADDQSMLRVSYRQGEALPGKVFGAGRPERMNEVDFRRDYGLTPEGLGLYRQATGGKVPVSSLLLPIMIEGKAIGLLVLDNFNTPAAFSEQDEALVGSLAQQAALSLENVRLFTETEQLAQQMEQRVIERTAELAREQQHTEKLLRKEQEDASRSAAILESVADGVVVTGSDNRISFLNASVERILTAEAAALRGQPLGALVELFGAAGSEWFEAVHRWSGAPGSHKSGESYAARLELSNDRVAMIHVAPVVLGTDFLGTVSILRDVTHEVEVDRLKSEFVATASHELRTPITSMKGYVEMLQMGAAGAVNENQSHFLEIVARNINRLNTLVDGMLDISRIETAKVALAQEQLDLPQIVADAIGELRRKSGEDHKTMAFSLQSAPGLPHIRGDAERIRQIVMIVLDNAYHYTPEGGSVQADILRGSNPDELQLAIMDNGVGIPLPDQERVFERFYRGEDPLVLATPGAGLGLSIAKQLVEMHHGRISLTSEGIAGKGSTFTVALPVYEGSALSSSSGSSGQPSAPTEDTPPAAS